MSMDILPSSPCHCSALRKASRRVSQIYDTAFSPAGLTNNQFSLLWEIKRRSSHPPTMGDLAAVAVMDRSTLGHNLRSLVRDGLVKLVRAKDDRRSRRVHLTAAGSERLSQASKSAMVEQSVT